MRVYVTGVVVIWVSMCAAMAHAQEMRPTVSVGISASLSGRTGAGGAYSIVHDPAALKGTASWGRCSVGVSPDPKSEALFAWRVDGRVVSLTAAEATVEFIWQRILSNGASATAPGGTVRQTLRLGERVTLDFVADVPTCVGTHAALTYEVKFEATRAGAARAGGGAVRAGGADAAEVTGGRGGRTASGGTSLLSAYDVDLWLVHSAPNREDRVTHQTMRADNVAAPFQFAPVQIETAEGTVTVAIQGSIATTTGVRGREFIFVADRRVTLAPLNRPARDQPVLTQGGTRITQAMPDSDEVLAFQMPGLRVPGLAPLADRFAIRVRISPAR